MTPEEQQARDEAMQQDLRENMGLWERGEAALKGLYKDKPSYEEVKRFKPGYRQVAKLLTGYSGSQLENYTDRTFRMESDKVKQYFGNANTPEQMNDAIAKYVKEQGTSSAAVKTAFEQASRDELVMGEETKDPRDSRRQTLRSRFKLDGPETVAESPMISVGDVVQSDLFSWKPTNENGTLNSVHLDQKRNEYILQQDSGNPRPPHNLEELILPYQCLPEYRDQQNVGGFITDKIISATVEGGLKYGPPNSIALRDQAVQVDPFGLSRTQSTFLVNTSSLQRGFIRDFTQGVQPGEMDAVGYVRGEFAMWRNDDPRTPQNTDYTPPMSSKRMVEIEQQGVGYDYLY